MPIELKRRILPDSFEESFIIEYMKILNKAEVDGINYVTQFVVEDYPEQVGRLKAIRELQDKFAQLVHTFFPE